MAIKNYTSKMAPSESLGKIQSMLAEHGAMRIQMEYNEQRKPEALSFSMFIGGQEIFFRLTVDVRGMLMAMEDDSGVPNSKCTEEQAERTAWKNKLEWLHIQLSEIASNQAKMEQLLLGYAVTDNGQTAFERLQSNSKLLTGETL